MCARTRVKSSVTAAANTFCSVSGLTVVHSLSTTFLLSVVCRSVLRCFGFSICPFVWAIFVYFLMYSSVLERKEVLHPRTMRPSKRPVIRCSITLNMGLSD